jgi:excisionase family DNA binding protein
MAGRRAAVRHSAFSSFGRPHTMNDAMPRAMTEREVAAHLGLSVATLRAWRLRRKGPRFVRFGRSVRYLEDDLRQFVESSRAWRRHERSL